MPVSARIFCSYGGQPALTHVLGKEGLMGLGQQRKWHSLGQSTASLGTAVMPACCTLRPHAHPAPTVPDSCCQ